MLRSGLDMANPVQRTLHLWMTRPHNADMRRFVVFAVLLSLPAGAQSPDGSFPALEPMALPFRERFTDRVPVSGRFLVGLMVMNGAAPPSGEGLATGRLRVSRPSDGPTEPLCIRATIQDGRYTAENAYAPPTAAGWVPLAWPTAYAAALSTVPMREVAALATLGPCSSHNLAIVPVTTSPVAEGTMPNLVALANTRGAATWAALRDPVAGGPAIRRVRCIRLEEGNRVAFDARCLLGPFPAGLARLELRLEQQSRDGTGTEVVEQATLHLPALTP
ncbi:hypothetical protein ACFQY5_41025 [Paeniroseomonas aquatica]|uniref:hypothetical protein n=1 Tax=Paeniroseomonas aquatica TaxID=373043 RepID=UPI0036065873